MAAPSAKLMISFLFLMTLSFSVQIYARESQFFSKVTTLNIPAKEKTPLPKTEEPTSSEQEEQPAFIPDAQGGYGLYGHESTPSPTTTTPTNVPAYKTQFTSNPTNVPNKNEFEDEESLNKYLNANDNNDNNNNNYFSGAKHEYYNNNYYNNKINRNGATQNGWVDPRFMEKEYTTTPNENNYYSGANQNRQGMSDTRFNGANQNGLVDTRFTEKEYTTPANENNYYSGANNNRQGMSDTRFLENGKYYYDINNENLNYNPNQYGHSRAVNVPTNGYGNKVYYGNRDNSFENNKSMEEYQNEEDDQFVP